MTAGKPRLGRWAAKALCVLGVLGFSCLQVVDTSALDEGCPNDKKACAGKCVSLANPDSGCAAVSCRPCVIPNATAHCSTTGGCVVASCRGDFLDCNDDGDSDDTDGCEVDSAHDPLHCGGCDAKPCLVANGKPGCAGRHCAIALCDSGFRDCNHSVQDGCEVDVSSAHEDCGHCGTACAAEQNCVNGVCLD